MKQHKLKLLTEAEISNLKTGLSRVIHYRKSGLSLNHIIGCPLECSYCVRHKDDNWHMKTPSLIMSSKDAVKLLLTDKFFQPNVTPIQLFNKATDCMIPSVKPHLFETLSILDSAGITNHVLLITRYKIEKEDCERLNRIKNLKITVLITYSGIENKAIEPIENKIPIESLKTAFINRKKYRTILYWRPIIPGINDSIDQIDFVLNELSNYADAIVFTGLFFSESIRDFFRENKLPEIYNNTARRKIFPDSLEQRILERVKGTKAEDKLFRKTSCGVSFVHNLPDYNGHFGIQELCDICPRSQYAKCKESHKTPKTHAVIIAANKINIDGLNFFIEKDRAIIFENIEEEYRYYMQHSLGFQVHNKKYPHERGQHGRADEFRDFKINRL